MNQSKRYPVGMTKNFLNEEVFSNVDYSVKGQYIGICYCAVNYQNIKKIEGKIC